MNWRSAAGLWVGMISIALLFAHCTPRHRTRIVLITLDTLRYDGVFPREGERSSMPLLHERAQAATRFTRFYSTTSVTQPTHATLFTSLSPWDHGVTRNGQSLPAGFATLAERLRDAGYQSQAVVASFPLSERFGFGQGFDQYVEEFTMGQLDNWKSVEVPDAKFFTLANNVTERAIQQISTASGDLQFFWFHYFDAHAPYGVTGGERLSASRIFSALERGEAGPKQLLERARSLYRSDLAYLDSSMDRLLNRLDADSQQFETHVFITADHGESFGEAGSIGHGSRLSAAEIHVPAILISPRLRPGPRSDVAGAIDVAPTLLSLARLDAIAGELAGRDLTQETAESQGVWGMRQTSARGKLTEKRLDGRTYTLPRYWFYTVDLRGHISRGNGKRIDHPSGDGDSAEARRIGDRFRSFEERLEANPDHAEPDAETRAALEALGYLQ